MVAGMCRNMQTNSRQGMVTGRNGYRQGMSDKHGSTHSWGGTNQVQDWILSKQTRPELVSTLYCIKNTWVLVVRGVINIF
jgi:hypothetical protein